MFDSLFQEISKTIQLDVNDLSAGRYFIKITNSKQVINQSFVVIK